MSAEHVARARREFEEARALHHQALKRTEEIRAKIDAAKARQQAITQARIAGTSDTAETAEFGALAADLEALAPMLEAAKAAAAALEPVNQRRLLESAEAMHRGEIAQAEYDAMLERVQKLEVVLCQAVTTLHEKGQALGFVSLSRSWPVSRLLQRAVRDGAVPRA